MARLATPLTPLIALTLAGCVAGERYPSLARRGAERATGTAQAVTPAAPDVPELAAPTGDLPARLAALVASAREGHARFQAARPATERAVAGAQGGSDERWATGSTTLAALENLAAPAAAALAELDRAEADRRLANGGADDASTSAIAEARSAIAPLAQQDNAVIAALAARLRR